MMKRYYITVSIEDAERAIRTHPMTFDHKRGFEVLCACVLAKTLPEPDGEFPQLVLPTRDGYRPGDLPADVSLWEILDSSKVSDDDSDFGLKIGGEARMFQATRLICGSRDDHPFETLKELIKKKMRGPRDDSLSLVILSNETFDYPLVGMEEWFSKQAVPFGNVVMITQEGISQNHGEFRCLTLFPEFLESITVRLHIYGHL